MLTSEQRHRHSGGHGDGERIRVSDLIGGAANVFSTGSWSRNSSGVGGGTGNQSITGVGFQPDMVVLIGAQEATSHLSFGAYDGTTQSRMQNDVPSGGFFGGTSQIFNIRNGSNKTIATLVSLDADGFTINWEDIDVKASGIWIAFKKSL